MKLKLTPTEILLIIFAAGIIILNAVLVHRDTIEVLESGNIAREP